MEINYPMMKHVPPRRVSGFTLVEVVIALGITTFAVVTVLGLLPVGFQTMREATSQTHATIIMNQIQGEVSATPFENLPRLAGQRFFTFNGLEVSDENLDKHFEVRILTPEEASFPGSSTLGNLDRHLRKLDVEIHSPGGRSLQRKSILISRSDMAAASGSLLGSE